MSSDRLSSFEKLLIESNNQLGTAVALVLAWIAASDGGIHKSELKQLNQVATDGQQISVLFKVLTDRDTNALQLACELLQKNLNSGKANLFMEMAIGMAVADGYLLPSENHILRFVADVLGISHEAMNSLFLEATGKPIPEPSDPSKASYWQSRNRSRKQQETNGSSRSSRNSGTPYKPSKTTARAYATLGLEPGATKEEIKKAYRHLAQVHHPDRFSSLGEESVATATSTFQRIRAAYDHLMAYA